MSGFRKRVRLICVLSDGPCSEYLTDFETSGRGYTNEEGRKMSKKHLHNYSKPRLYKSRTKEKTCPKGLCKTIANRSQNKGNCGPDRNPHPVLTLRRVFRPLRIIFMDLCCPFGPHWILKGSQNQSFSHKIVIKCEKMRAGCSSRNSITL